jgi:hypothetical protein
MNVYFVAEESATQRGWVGLTINEHTHQVIRRTPHTYPDATWAKVAAKKAWEQQEKVA